MLREYDYYAQAFRQSEEFGEKRVTSFLTLAAGAAAALGFILGDKGLDWGRPDFIAIAVTAGTVWLFGQLTLARLVKRNVASDEYKEALAWVRAWFVERNDTVSAYLYHYTNKKPKSREVGVRKLVRGGWVEMMFVTNSLLLAVAASACAAAAGKLSKPEYLVPLLVAIASAVTLFVINVGYTKRRYDEGCGALRGDVPAPLQARRERGQAQK